MVMPRRRPISTTIWFGEHRVAAEVEEAVVYADRLDPQRPLPDGGDLVLDGGPRRHVLRVQVWSRRPDADRLERTQLRGLGLVEEPGAAAARIELEEVAEVERQQHRLRGLAGAQHVQRPEPGRRLDGAHRGLAAAAGGGGGGGGHARRGARAPVDTDGRQADGAMVMGQCVEERVGGRVVSLAWRASTAAALPSSSTPAA
jgi:hypothetical protein